MSIPAFVQGFETMDYHTEAANTVIDEEIQAKDGYRLAVIDFLYLAAATAHVASFMYANATSRTVTTALAVSGQQVINVAAALDPAGNAAAAGDIIAFQLTDGTWEFDTVASLATLAITCTNNITGVDAGAGGTAIAEGAKVNIFGIVADGAVMNLSLTASVLNQYGEGRLSIVHPYMGEPFYLSIDNATNAGFLHYAVMAHINK